MVQAPLAGRTTGVPYLAGTYDERMYEELRLRAQTFEVLTGGDLAADHAEGYDDQHDAEGREAGLRFVPLRGAMMNGLRVNLHVWVDADGAEHENQAPDDRGVGPDTGTP